MKSIRQDDLELLPFAERLANDHYNAMDHLCADARRQAEGIKSLELHESAVQFAKVCMNIIDEVERHIADRKANYIPYIADLSRKVAANHNCSACQGGCKIEHEMKIPELKASNELMKRIMAQLNITSLPLYAETMYPDKYRVLRNQMALIETGLTELLFLENNYLAPKIAEAQKLIYAANR